MRAATRVGRHRAGGSSAGRHDVVERQYRCAEFSGDWKPGTVRVGYAVGDHALVVSHVVLPLHRIPP
jgi:hypothetical protein